MKPVAALVAILLTCLAAACHTGSSPRATTPPEPAPAVTTTAAAPVSAPAPAAMTPPAAPDHAGDLLVTREQSLALRDMNTGKEQTLFTTPPNQFVSFPAWSPDGRQFLFVLETPYPSTATPLPSGVTPDWGSDLYLADAGGARQRLLLKHDAPGVQIASPSWSADGQSVLFTYLALTYDQQHNVQGVVNQARRLDLDRGQITTVIDDAIDAEICPSGGKMTYVKIDRETGTHAAVVIADANGANPRNLVTPTGEAQAFRYPRLAAACSRIVFAAVNVTGSRQNSPGRAPLPGALLQLFEPPATEAHASVWELWSVDVDGTNLRRLTHLAEDEPYPTWSADGRTIVFLGAGGLYEMAGDGGKLRTLGRGTGHGQVSWRQH